MVSREIMVFGPERAIAGVFVCAPVIMASLKETEKRVRQLPIKIFSCFLVSHLFYYVPATQRVPSHTEIFVYFL